MANIKLSPEELMSQGDMMSTLCTEYEQLFSSVSSILEQTNQNWSENLSHNFAGKIISAQKSFSNLVDMLQFGADAARTSATGFQDVDSALSKTMSGRGKGIAVKAAASIAGGGGNIIDGGNKKKTTAKENSSAFGAVTKKFDSAKAWYKKHEEAIKAYGKSAFRITKGAVKVVGAVAAITTGVGIPVAATSFISGMNDIGNGAADMIYSAYGEYDKVGKTDVLKTLTEKGYGDIGELLGNREAGEMFGRVAYTGLDVVSFLNGANSMLKTFGKLNTDLYGTVNPNSPIFGKISMSDTFDNTINWTTKSGFVRNILGWNPDSTANLIYESVKGTASTFGKGISTAGKMVDAIMGV